MRRGRLLETGKRRYPGDFRFATRTCRYRIPAEIDSPPQKIILRQALRSQLTEDPYSNEFLGTLFLLDENLPAALKYWNRTG
jgi:hypothetical protein